MPGRHAGSRSPKNTAKRSPLLVIALAVAGALLVMVGLSGAFGWFNGKQAASSAPPRPAATTPAATPTKAAPPASVRPLAKSTPTQLDVPAIGVHTSLMQLGLNADRTVQVPPLGKDAPAGWYKNSPTPGQIGPAIILGHVDSAKDGPAVFYKLNQLKPGDQVKVSRQDGTVAIFRVDHVETVKKRQFPTRKIYGDIDHAGLRLITCGGKFDLSARSYEDNTVVFASLVSTSQA